MLLGAADFILRELLPRTACHFGKHLESARNPARIPTKILWNKHWLSANAQNCRSEKKRNDGDAAARARQKHRGARLAGPAEKS
jgi:hypothetical protein